MNEFLDDLQRWVDQAAEDETPTIGYVPIAPTADAPRDSKGNPEWLWIEFENLMHLALWLNEHGIEDLPLVDDIEAAACQRVADALATDLEHEQLAPRDFLESQIQLWKSCGGYRFGGFFSDRPSTKTS